MNVAGRVRGHQRQMVDRDVIRLTNGTVIRRGISDGPTGEGVGSADAGSKNCRPRFKALALQVLRDYHECERCGSRQEVRQEPCRTAYADPAENISPWLCRPCAEEYHDNWDEMWADYYSGQGLCSRSSYIKAMQEARGYDERRAR